LPISDSRYQEPGDKTNRFLYQGKEWQTSLALNLYDFHARHGSTFRYDPATGRFTGIDPQGQFASGYVGMGNMPTVGVDPDGELVWFVAAAIWGAAISSAAYTANVAFSDGGFNPT